MLNNETTLYGSIQFQIIGRSLNKSIFLYKMAASQARTEPPENQISPEEQDVDMA